MGSRLLSLDLGARFLGWSCETTGLKPAHGLILLPGTKELGKLFAAARNGLERLLDEHEPTRICYVVKFSRMGKTAVRTSEALSGVQAMVDLVAYDNGLPEPTRYTSERNVRKAVLGRGDFGLRDEHNRLIPESGRDEAKKAVLEWCAARGLHVLSHDVADALILLKHDQMLRTGKG